MSPPVKRASPSAFVPAQSLVIVKKRRVQVRKEGRRKPEPVTFAAFAAEWLATLPGRA